MNVIHVSLYISGRGGIEMKSLGHLVYISIALVNIAKLPSKVIAQIYTPAIRV